MCSERTSLPTTCCAEPNKKGFCRSCPARIPKTFRDGSGVLRKGRFNRGRQQSTDRCHIQAGGDSSSNARLLTTQRKKVFSPRSQGLSGGQNCDGRSRNSHHTQRKSLAQHCMVLHAHGWDTQYTQKFPTSAS